MSMLKRDQIHGDIEFSKSELKLIDSKSFVRQRYIRQLGFVDCEYPGATHTREAHALGTCACVTDMYNAVITNNPKFYREGDLELLRMCALVHDMGHAPFSHSSEELSTISHEDRLYGILELEKNNIVFPNPYDIESWELVFQVYNGSGLTYLSDKHLISLHSFLDNVIDADKLDYLERDALNCGVSYGNFDRDGLVNNLTMLESKNNNFVMAVKTPGVQALESFILARYYMFSQVYMSPMERLRRQMFCDEMKALLPGGIYPEDAKKFLQLDDSRYIRRLKCITTLPYTLVYDGEYNIEIKSLIDRKLGEYLVCDTPRQSVFRRETEESPILIVDPILDRVIPSDEASPLLRLIENMHIHKLRYYTKHSLVDSMREQLKKLLKGGVAYDNIR